MAQPDDNPPLAPARPLVHVVLHEPEIPNNTGNIGRTCVATGSRLHLIRPLGFDISEKACRRAGLDYWPRLAPATYDHWDDYLARNHPGAPAPRAGAEPQTPRPPALWLFTTKVPRPVVGGGSAGGIDFRRGDHLVFGKETKGLPAALLDRYPDRCVSLPMLPGERSLNLATAVCAAVYLVIDQLVRRGDLGLTALGRLPGAERLGGDASGGVDSARR